VLALISYQLTKVLFPNYNDSLLITKKPTATQGLLLRNYPVNLQKAYYLATTTTQNLWTCNPHLREAYYCVHYSHKRPITIKRIVTNVLLP